MKELIDFLRELLPWAIGFNLAILAIFFGFFGVILVTIIRLFNRILKQWDR